MKCQGVTFESTGPVGPGPFLDKEGNIEELLRWVLGEVEMIPCRGEGRDMASPKRLV